MAGKAEQVKVVKNEANETDKEPKSKTVKIKRTKEKQQPENCCMNVKEFCVFVSWILLTGLSFFTLQYVPNKMPKGTKGKVIITILYAIYTILGTSILGSLINLYPTIMILLNWAWCKTEYYHVCYVMVLHNPVSSPTQLPNIVMRDNPANNISNAVTASELEKFTDYGKLVLLFSATSGTISYLILIYRVLWIQYIKEHLPWSLYCGGKGANEGEIQPLIPEEEDQDQQAGERGGPNEGETQPLIPEEEDSSPLHPFNNDKRSSTSTKLEADEGYRFLLFLLINVFLVFGMIAVFLCGLYVNNQQPVTIEKSPGKTRLFDKLQITTVSLYCYTLLCTISSCFIFSKVMFGIQNKCDNLFISDDEAKGTLKERINEDKRFVKKAIATQGPFELWFFIHWVMYIITSFLSISFLFEAIYEKIQGSLPHRQAGINFSALELIFLALFAFSNSFFFLYPCIRAAGVTESRKILIRDVSNSVDNANAEHRAFVSYLKEQKFGFRLNILCAHVTFSLNIAYISIFIGLLGVLIKVGSSI